MHGLWLTRELSWEITRVNLWHIVSRQNLACNHMHKVNEEL